MKGVACLHLLRAGLFAWAVGTGCAQAPIEQKVERPPDPMPAQAAKDVERPITVAAADSPRVVTVTKPDATPAMIVSAETLKTGFASNLPIQPACCSKMDVPPLPDAKPEVAKISGKSLVQMTEPAEKKSSSPLKSEEKKIIPAETSIKQTKLEIAVPSSPRIVPPSPAKKDASLAMLVDKPAPKKAAVASEAKPAQPEKQVTTPLAGATRTGHAADYTWLYGQLQYWPLHKTWRLRYAGIDTVDPYGGSVTLTADLRPTDLKDGQYVRVEGRLADPEARGISPAYKVESIRALDR
ncbi:MAG TPA: hypothetical protein VGY58_19785 [Gemmataceae bacterium]|nr:hypothetical protein [Gemmataceae bacterium]